MGSFFPIPRFSSCSVSNVLSKTLADSDDDWTGINNDAPWRQKAWLYLMRRGNFSPWRIVGKENHGLATVDPFTSLRTAIFLLSSWRILSQSFHLELTLMEQNACVYCLIKWQIRVRQYHWWPWEILSWLPSARSKVEHQAQCTDASSVRSAYKESAKLTWVVCL